MDELHPVILWFRLDLRLDDNPALDAACKSGRPVIPVYIHDPESEGEWCHGAASHWWLHHSLKNLASALASHGSSLILRRGNTLSELEKLAAETGAGALFWNRRYEPAVIERDKKIKEVFEEKGIETQSFNSHLLNEPWTIQTGSGTPFKVFTPYWNKSSALPPAGLFEAPAHIQSVKNKIASLSADALGLLPEINWYAGMEKNWVPGEAGAKREIETFLEGASSDYLNGRDAPALRGTSRLSPHLHFGEISPRRVVQAVQKKSARSKAAGILKQGEGYVRQIYWREFAHHLLYHFPQTTGQPLRAEFSKFEWKQDEKNFTAWKKGMTGYPIVDAGMRELWHTGWMHNRVRMIAASFLVKDLLISWTKGAEWFWDTLVDADLANNTLGWQWVAGCGADAAPYFRIFNPVTQSEKFDPEGTYIRRWVPEIAGLEAKWIHSPWDAPTEVLQSARIEIGKTYPAPIVDHAQARKRALMLYDRLKGMKSGLSA